MSKNKNKPTPDSLSICMIAKNEATILPRCLESIKDIADELIIVDTGSEDDTVAIAEEYGAAVIRSDWRNDFSYSRNISIDHAQCEWILWLDADDVIPSESIEPIKALKKTEPNRVYGFIIRNEKPGGTGSEFYQARMFPNHPQIRFERKIHEQIMLSALRIGLELDNREIIIEHHGYADPKDVKIKAQRNIDALLDEYNYDNPDPVMAIEVADAYSILGDWQKSAVWYENALKPPNVETSMPIIASHAHLGIGKAFIEENDLSRAISHINRSLDLCPKRPDALYSLAVAYELEKNLNMAIDCLKKIISIEAKPLQVSVDAREAKIKAFLRLERILAELNRNDEAIDLAGLAIKDLSNRPEIYNMLGRTQLRAGKLVDALHTFEKSLQIAMQGNIDAYIGLCSVYLKAGRKDAADKTVETITPLFESYPRFLAFCKYFMENEKVSENISIDEIAAEAEWLKNLYAL